MDRSASHDYIDFHSHHPSLNGERVIQDGIHTRGRHPWHLEENLPSAEGVGEHLLAIGESGLDKLCSTPYDLQLRVFREEVALREPLRLPLLLHCVRAIDDVILIRRQLHARQPIIWHGYRGHARQLLQLLPHGFYFSFGLHHSPQALVACPPDRLLLETDDDILHPISDLYAQAAQLRAIALSELILQMHTNFQTLFTTFF